MELHVYRNTDKTDWVIAKSKEDALEVWAESMGEDRSDYPDMEFERVKDDAIIYVLDEDRSLPAEEHTAKTWAVIQGRGFLASTEF